MGKINLLSQEAAQLIAAGEVVERPSSVVKELVENSIDAGATHIIIEIKDGATSYIRISDNGCGMNSEDTQKAFMRHATSKISDINDLNVINTLGFRGEALASIASVARVELLTCVKDSISGTHIRIEGAEVFEKGEAGCPNGTTITVRDLFYNTPARLKFLKKNRTEGSHVAGVVERIALSHPEISMRFINDGKEQMFTPGDGKLIGAIYAIYGKKISENLIETDYEYNNIKVSGYISRPVFGRGNRKLQNFFINGRIAGSRILTASLEEGYRDSIMTGKYPVCFLNIKINSQDIDVNVHPAKAEVKFSNDNHVFDVVCNAVKSALSQEDRRYELSIDTNSDSDSKLRNSLLGYNDTEAEQIKLAPESAETDNGKKELCDKYSVNISNIEMPYENLNQPMISESLTYKAAGPDFIPTFRILDTDAEKSANHKEMLKIEKDDIEDFQIIGEAFNTYIIVQIESEICFIDKHAAHERMIYEELKDKDKYHIRQPLLEPAVMQLQKDELEVIKDNISIIEDYGFTIEDFGAGSIIVREIPDILTGEDPYVILTAIAQDLLEAKVKIKTNAQSKILHTIACKAAIKAGKKNTVTELYAIVKKLFDLPDIKYCPHGRPVIFTITRKSLEKQFRRLL